jgi:serine/threonine protein kinase
VRNNDPALLFAHENEFLILKLLDHKNIVHAIELFKDEFKSEVYIVMQYVEGKEIMDMLAEMGRYDERDARHICKQMLEGLEYMHAQRVCHRDIKPSNILITKSKDVFIADFNVAKHVPEQG